MSRHVVVVGGGIAGLTAAYELTERGATVTLVEASGRLGGKIRTSRGAGYVIEAGADSFLSSKPSAAALCRRLGLEPELVNSRTDDKRTFVYSRGRLRQLPEGLVLGSPARAGGLLRSGLVSPLGAARMALEIAVPARRAGADETVASFFTRRLGRQAYERVVEPLLGGIHAGDAAQLSLPATFPRFSDQERDHGGLLRATLASRPRRSSPPAPKPNFTPFLSLRAGMSALPEALAAALAAAGATVLTGTAVLALRRTADGRYELETAGDGDSRCSRSPNRSSPAPRTGTGAPDAGAAVETLTADAVVLATPAHVTATLLPDIAPEAAAALAEVPHASTATVSLVLDRAASARQPEGFGFVVPRAERRDLIAATWSSQKWPGRAPDGQMVLRGYVGGVGREAVLDRSDDDLTALVRRELEALAGVTGEPVHVEVHRYPLGMPQYTLGHRDRVAQARAAVAACPGLALTGAAYGGVGIPDCITDATAAAGALASALALPAR